MATWNDRFSAIYLHMRAHIEAGQPEREALQNEYNGAIADAWRAIHPKSRKGPQFDERGFLISKQWREVSRETRDAITAEYEARARGMSARQDWHTARCERALRFLAKRCTVPQTEKPTLYKTRDSYEFNSQGFGADHYAEQAARVNAIDVSADVRAEVWPALRYWWHRRGADGRVEPLTGSNVCGNRYGTSEYRVMIYTDEIGAEIVRRRPGIGMREWVKACWKQGINPRVLNPWLPYEFEQRNGLDYYGGEVQQKSA